MRVLRVITWLPPGGIERRLVALLPRLREAGIEPELVCIRERGPLAEQIEAAGVPVHLVPFRTRWDFRGLRGLSRLIRERRIELVHAHMYRANVPATVAARRAGVPMLGQVHNVDTWQNWRQRWMDRLLARRRAGMIAVSRRVAEDVVRTLRLPTDKVHVIYNGIELETFAPDAGRRAARRAELSLRDDHVAALCPARLHPQKNHAGLLRAWSAALGALPEEARDRSVLLLAGEGSARADLERQAADLEERGAMPRGSVRFLGHCAEMADLYRAADLMVLPSFKEGFSNAVVEAMAVGLAIVATDVGGNAEALEDGRSGLIVPPGDEEALACALQRTLGDPELRDTLARNARERSRLFSLDRMIEETAALYRRILDRPA